MLEPKNQFRVDFRPKCYSPLDPVRPGAYSCTGAPRCLTPFLPRGATSPLVGLMPRWPLPGAARFGNAWLCPTRRSSRRATRRRVPGKGPRQRRGGTRRCRWKPPCTVRQFWSVCAARSSSPPSTRRRVCRTTLSGTDAARWYVDRTSGTDPFRYRAPLCCAVTHCPPVSSSVGSGLRRQTRTAPTPAFLLPLVPDPLLVQVFPKPCPTTLLIRVQQLSRSAPHTHTPARSTAGRDSQLVLWAWWACVWLA